ncbi:BQ2448_4915 [Microbotryum intermedium]|uniref:BQ2448_4915 protein n=1 Tax=Microbotryum intermedium TaxID=269621 RepID=A0A238FJ88_9BASI|nr:BQ2448_4915 [Microbotryum intermedium]
MTLLNIPLPCKLEHLIGEQTLVLGEAGALALVAPSPPTAAPSNSIDESATVQPGDVGATGATTTKEMNEIVVVLKVGEMAFPLSKNTPFGTTKDPYSYLFKPSLAGAGWRDSDSSLTSGWIRLTLPSSTAQAFPQLTSQDQNSANTPSSVYEENQALFLKLRDSFEQALIELGLITDSLVLSTADDIGQSTRASLARMAQYIDEKAQARMDASEPVKLGEELKLGQRTNHLVGGVGGASQGVRDVSNKLTAYVQQGTVWVGDQVGKRIPAGRKGEVQVEEGAEGSSDMSTWAKTKTVVGSIADGIADGSTTLALHTSQAAQEVVTHSKGSDAGEVVKTASQTAANIGGAASDVVVKTSAALLGGMAVKAAVDADRSTGEEEQGEDVMGKA